MSGANRVRLWCGSTYRLVGILLISHSGFSLWLPRFCTFTRHPCKVFLYQACSTRYLPRQYQIYTDRFTDRYTIYYISDYTAGFQSFAFTACRDLVSCTHPKPQIERPSLTERWLAVRCMITPTVYARCTGPGFGKKSQNVKITTPACKFPQDFDPAPISSMHYRRSLLHGCIPHLRSAIGDWLKPCAAAQIVAVSPVVCSLYAVRAHEQSTRVLICQCLSVHLWSWTHHRLSVHFRVCVFRVRNANTSPTLLFLSSRAISAVRIPLDDACIHSPVSMDGHCSRDSTNDLFACLSGAR